MESLADMILERAGRLPEGTPVSAITFLDLGTKPAIRNTLLRLVPAQKLFRVAKGIYVVPVVGRFGSSAPSAHQFIEELSKQSGDDIVSSDAATANALGLTTQVPVQVVYWTSGRSRKLNLGKLVLHLERVASWQLVLAKEPAGEIVRVLAWAGPEHVLEEELPERYSTAKSHRSNIKNYLRPRWGDYLLEKIRPMAVEDWLKNLSMAPKSKAHIRSVMHLMFECATRWELFNERRNPIALVRVKGGSKRRQRPTSLTVEEFELIVATLQEPWRTMVQIAQCLGLRVSEIAALQWDDFDFDKNQLLVQRSFVNGRVDDVKTEYSQDYVPLHPCLTEIVLKWSTHAVATEEGWVFANPRTNRPYYPTEIQKRHLRPSGCCVVACPTCGAAPGVWCNQDQKTGNGVRMLLHETRVKNSGKYGGIGWHTFRHTYRSWLDETGAPMKVQQELMRHASIQTTMNVYGQAMSSSKREANGKVVEMVLKPLKASA